MLSDVYQRLLQRLGPQYWWPAKSRLEVIVGAVLTQNTAWTNVERAIANLHDAGLLSLEGLAHTCQDELEELVRPAGYFRVKARRLRNVIEFIRDHYDGSLDAMFATGLETLRTELLGVNGIGPETADSILLYAGDMPSFVIDTYTARILKRHGWIEPDADYHRLKGFFESQLPTDVQLFNEYHALIVSVGKDYCRAKPKCEGCPLQELLPEHGPVEFTL